MPDREGCRDGLPFRALGLMLRITMTEITTLYFLAFPRLIARSYDYHCKCCSSPASTVQGPKEHPLDRWLQAQVCCSVPTPRSPRCAKRCGPRRIPRSGSLKSGLVSPGPQPVEALISTDPNQLFASPAVLAIFHPVGRESLLPAHEGFATSSPRRLSPTRPSRGNTNRGTTTPEEFVPGR